MLWGLLRDWLRKVVLSFNSIVLHSSFLRHPFMDRGTHFVSKLISQLALTCGFVEVYTRAHTFKQCNDAKEESLNCRVLAMLAKTTEVSNASFGSLGHCLCSCTVQRLPSSLSGASIASTNPASGLHYWAPHLWHQMEGRVPYALKLLPVHDSLFLK